MAEEEERDAPEPGGDRAGRRRLLPAAMAPVACPYPKAAATGAVGPREPALCWQQVAGTHSGTACERAQPLPFC